MQAFVYISAYLEAFSNHLFVNVFRNYSTFIRLNSSKILLYDKMIWNVLTICTEVLVELNSDIFPQKGIL